MKAIEKIKAGNIDLSEDEIIELLRINNFSSEYYDLLAASNALSRRKFGNRGYVFTQIGINAEPCPINCNYGGTKIEWKVYSDKCLLEIGVSVNCLFNIYYK